MSTVTRCDRCGKIYDPLYIMHCPSIINQEWWRYKVVRDCHPYEEIKVDLCPNCRKNLVKWLKGENI